SEMSLESASALRTDRMRFSMRTPVCTRSISRELSPGMRLLLFVRADDFVFVMVPWYQGTTFESIEISTNFRARPSCRAARRYNPRPMSPTATARTLHVDDVEA